MSARTRVPRGVGARGFAIATALMAAVVIAQMSLIAVVAAIASEQIDEAAYDTYGYVGDLTVEQISQVARDAADVVSDVAVAVEWGVHEDGDTLQALMLDELEQTPAVRAVYVGWEDGSFLSVTREEPGHRVQQIAAGSGTARTTIFDAAGATAETSVEETEYDPRTRPWFEAAVVTNGVVWSDAYLDYGNLTTLASPARALRAGDDVGGVVAADLDVTYMQQLLDNLPYGSGAEGFVATPDGAVIAAPTVFTPQLEQIAAESQRVPTLEDLGVDFSGVVLAPGEETFSDDGGAMTLDRALAADAGVDWQVHLVADASQLSAGLGELGVALWWALGVSVVVTACAIALVWSVRHSMGRMHLRASTDHLTGVLNRHGFERAGADLLAQAAVRGDRVLAVAIDLDDFKLVNDELGHQVGDAALAAVGDALRASIRGADVAARVGGDEFVVIQSLDRVEDPQGIVDRIRENIARELSSVGIEGKTVTVTSGSALLQRGMDLAALTAAADAALVRGKRAGKGRAYLA